MNKVSLVYFKGMRVFIFNFTLILFSVIFYLNTRIRIFYIKLTQGVSMTKNKIKVSNDFINSIIKKNNHLTLKVLFYLVLNGVFVKKSHSMEMTEFKISSSDLKKDLNLDFKNLRQNIKLVQNSYATFESKYFIDDYVLIPYIRYDYQNSIITFRVFDVVLSFFHDLKNKFTIIDFDNLLQLNSKHSIRLLLVLENLNGFNFAKNKTLTLQELNDLFDTKYKSIREIERAILLPVQKELDQFSKLTFIYDLLYDLDCPKVGRKPLIGVKIYLKDNKQRQLKMF